MTDLPAARRDEVSILDLVAFLLKYWIILVAACVIGAGLGFGITFLLQKEYKAEIVLSYRSSDEQQGLASSLSSAVSGLGLGLSALSGESNDRTIAMEALQSKQSIISFINERNLKPVLFANQWDQDTGQWSGKPPSDNRAFNKFSEHVLNVDDDTGRNVTTVSITWRDPQVASKWLTDYINEINEHLRRDAVKEAEGSINFLNQRIQTANIAEVRQTLAQLLKHNIEMSMLANIHEDYAFKIIDPVVPPDDTAPSFPKPILFAAVGMIAAFLLTFFGILARNLAKSARASLR